MTVAGFFFYLFSVVACAAAVMVISSRNPVHSVLFLILTFFNAAGLFILMGAEFLALILVVVYVGAVAVLFLFVVMMLDVDFAELRRGALSYLPIGGAIGIILLVELILVLGSWQFSGGKITEPFTNGAGVTNTAALGLILYTKYFFYFQVAGLVLLVAMIGAIVLTLRHKVGVRRQNVADQVARGPATSIEVRQVRPGQGI
jgi:NADH-quinone oxidoreductase subunit J